jgi:hypothetical protein
MQRILRTLVAIGICAFFAVSATAQDKKVDPTGTWTWTTPGRNGGEGRKMSLKLKLDGDKVTGAIVSPGRNGGDPVETAISEGKIKGDEITFTVVREFNGNKMTTKYTAKVTAESIKGKSETERNGQPQSRDFEAKKEVKN